MPFVIAGASNLFANLVFGAGGLFSGGGLAGLLGGGITGSLLKIGGSLLLSAASNALFAPRISAQDVAQQLSLPTNAPAYRFVYGRARAVGTPVGVPVRDENKQRAIWGCWLLNSRPSDLSEFKLFLDKREVLVSGDPFNFAGSGALATAAPFVDHCKFWIQRGDQTSPPAEFLSGAPWSVGNEDLYLPTDAWRGRTVLWMKLVNGGAKKRQERWPSAPPLVEMEGKWSKVWDPRNGAQSLTNPATWAWSENAALCTMDAATQNPIKQYQAAHLHLSSWIDGANVSDEAVPLLAGGTEPRYRLGGTLVFANQEIEDLLNPMFLSAAADGIRIGGKLGYAAGAYRAPEVTLDYFLGAGFEAPDMVEGDDLPNELRVSYVSPARGYDVASLRPWEVPGALGADNGLPAVNDVELSLCNSATQAQRVRKIMGGRLRRQDRLLGGELPPEAFNLVGGSTVNLALPSPYNVFNGIYEVEAISPGFDLMGDSGVAARIPAQLVKHSALIYAWNPATDEESIVDPPYNSSRTGISMPGAITVTTGAGVDLDTGGTVIPRIRFAFDPSPSAGIDGYEWQYRVDGGNWAPGGVIGADISDGSGKVFDYLVAALGSSYDIQVSAVSVGEASDYRQLLGVTIAFAVSGGSGVAGLGSAVFAGTAPINSQQAGIRIYKTATAVFDTVNPVGSQVAVASGAAFSITSGDAAISNMFTTPDFSAAGAWTLGTGWTIGSGKAQHVGPTAGTIGQTLTLTAGVTYRMGATISGRTVGSLIPQVSGGAVVSGATASANGRMVGKIVAGTAPNAARFSSTATFDGAIDDAALFVETPACLAQGLNYYWIVPVSITGVMGAPNGPFALTIT